MSAPDVSLSTSTSPNMLKKNNIVKPLNKFRKIQTPMSSRGVNDLMKPKLVKPCSSFELMIFVVCNVLGVVVFVRLSSPSVVKFQI